MSPAIETFELRKVYDEVKVAVEGLTLQVGRAEVFGFLGPNGAGKTTSIKMLLGLVRPTAGYATVLGCPISSPRARREVGFLPEHFRFHEWLRAAEFLDLHGQLYGMSRADRRERSRTLLELVGLGDVAHRPLRTFSKGMLQRIGLAMALLPRPALVFLDEPTSGLDPFGRLLVRDVIRKARDEGTTIFLNSHLLSEIEATCDRVAFIRQGRVIRAGRLDELSGGPVRARVRLDHIPAGLISDLRQWGERIEQQGEREVHLSLSGEERLAELNAWLIGKGLRVYELAQQRMTLEEIFVQIMGDAAGDEVSQ